MGFSRLPLCGAGLVLAAATAIAGCGGSALSASGASGAAASPLRVMELVAKTANGAHSFTGTVSLRTTVKPGSVDPSAPPAGKGMSMTATIAERLYPSLLVSVDIGTLSAGGQSFPGGIHEMFTPRMGYLKWSAISSMHNGKPWLAFPLSSVGKNAAVNLTQFLTSLQDDGPLTDSQMLGGATSVRSVSTSTIGGIPVTEYTGSFPIDKGTAHLPASTRARVRKETAAAGIATATFRVWIDGQHRMRRSVITESGKSFSEIITTTITSINEPVNIAIPPASQTVTDDSALSAGGGA